MMLAAALYEHMEALSERLPEIRRTLALLDAPDMLSEAQALLLTAAALELQPDVIIDLGTGSGNSAAIFALSGAPRVYTFDLAPRWEGEIVKRLQPSRCFLDRVTAIVGDLTEVDFSPLTQEADRVLVFWDAHGHDIAAHVLGHLMPLIADKAHLVICHDLGDRRYNLKYKPYAGKRLWRGMDDYSRNPATTAYAIVDWAMAIVDQAIPIFDFCWRNDIKLSSVDHEFRTELVDIRRDEGARRLDLHPESRFSIGYFTLNGAAARNFPAPR